jgi:hypothetical protein
LINSGAIYIYNAMFIHACSFTESIALSDDLNISIT